MSGSIIMRFGWEMVEYGQEVVRIQLSLKK